MSARERLARRLTRVVERDAAAGCSSTSLLHADIRALLDPESRIADLEATVARVEAFCSGLEATDDYVRSWKCARQLRRALVGDETTRSEATT